MIGDPDESRVHAESQTAASKNPEANRFRGEAGEAPGEGSFGRTGGEEGEGQEGKSEKRKGQVEKVTKVKPTKEELGKQESKKNTGVVERRRLLNAVNAERNRPSRSEAISAGLPDAYPQSHAGFSAGNPNRPGQWLPDAGEPSSVDTSASGAPMP